MEPNLLEIFASYTSWKCNEDTWIMPVAAANGSPCVCIPVRRRI